MIILGIGIFILFIILAGIMAHLGTESYSHDTLFYVMVILFLIIAIIAPILIGIFHGYIDYNESNDRDKARITAVTQEQNAFKTYYKIEVEYLTNTPTQSGIVTNYNIEKDYFYCYFDDKELVEKLRNNMYKELWLISGYKGGYETYKDFGTKLIKDIELLEEINND